MRRLLILTALVASAGAAQTPAPQPGFATPATKAAGADARPCLTPTEARNLATFVLPGLVEGLAGRCRRSLGPDAFLRRDEASALVQRLRRDAAPSWPVARQAIEKLTGGDRLPGLFGERFIMGVAESTAADLTLKQFDKADCGSVDDLVAGLAPLPSSNFSSVISALIALSGGSSGDDAPLRICTAPSTPGAPKETRR